MKDRRAYKDIAADFQEDPAGIMSDEDERVHAVKDIILHKLSQADRTIILCYADDQSYRKLGERLGCSHMTARNAVARVKAIILDEYAKLTK